MDGFSIGQKIEKMGMRGSPDRRAGFRRLPACPKKMCLGPSAAASKVLDVADLDYERVVLSGVQLGIMQACLDTVLPFVREAQAVRPADRHASS